MAAIPQYLDNFKDATVEIRIRRRLSWRLRLGTWIVRFGCWVATVGYREVRDA